MVDHRRRLLDRPVFAAGEITLEILQDFLGRFVAVEPDLFDGGVGAGVAADETAARQFDGVLPALPRTGMLPIMAIAGGELSGRDAPNFFMPADQAGEVVFGGRIGIFEAVARRGFDDENGFVSDDAADLVVFAVAGLEGAVGVGEDPAVAFAGSPQARSGIFQQGDQARIVFGGSLGQGKEAGRLRAGQGADHGPVRFAEELDAGGFDGDGFDPGVQTDFEPKGKDMGEVVVSLQDVKARAGGVGDDLIVQVEDGRDDGAKLAQAGEELFFEIARLRREVLDAEIDEVSLPELGRAPPPDDGSALEDADADARGLQSLGAA
jgi:hypothetical protein